MIGVAYGFPSEFRYLGRINEDKIDWTPDQVRGAIPQDDLYVGMTLAETMDRLGLEAKSEDYGAAFRDSKYRLWHANASARRWLNLGVKAPLSGHPRYNIHANDIDFQIEADFIGLMCPGMPQQSNELCDRVGHVMNYGDGVYGGMFVCGMYTTAYYETDVRKVVAQGLACLPAESEYAQIITDLLRWHHEHPDDWRATWKLIEAKWNKHDSCCEGALSPFNIDAKINGAYVALGLLYGNGDFARTLEVSTRAGQDSDCNPSTAAGILGVMIGYDNIPDEWKSGIPKVENIKFEYTESSLNDICKLTKKWVTKIAEANGGRTEGTDLVVVLQPALPAKLEQWSMGTPKLRLKTDDPAFTWSENWEKMPGPRGWHHGSAKAGASFTLKFTGTALALAGDTVPHGGRADVTLDGKPVHHIEAWSAEATYDDDLWHIYALENTPHTLTVKLRPDADDRSTGTAVMIKSAVVYE